jgi:hypothetical protein
MKPKTYIETSIVSYLTAMPSRDLVIAAHQQITHDWWADRAAFDLYISQFVLDEAAAGDASAAARRMEVLEEATLLEVIDDATSLARELLAGCALPQRAQVDAFHIAVSTVHGMDYLLSWNCTHIANAAMRSTIEAICRAAGFVPPVICTPLEPAKE